MHISTHTHGYMLKYNETARTLLELREDVLSWLGLQISSQVLSKPESEMRNVQVHCKLQNQ